MAENLNEGHRKRLREKFIKNGPDSLYDYELIELLLTFSIPRKDCKDMAKLMIEKFKNIAGVLDCEMKDLKEIDGVGDTSYVLFKLVKQLHKIYLIERKVKNISIKGTQDLLDYLRIELGSLKKEVFKVIFLNNANVFITEETISEGTIDRSHLYPREILERIFHHDAKSVIFVHNHPSGTLKPSEADKSFTSKMRYVLKELDIGLLDHVIICGENYFSFLEDGLL